MSKNFNPKVNIWPQFIGPVATLATLIAIELLARTIFRIPNPPAILIVIVVFSAFTGGLYSGLASAAIVWIYFAYFFSIPGQPFHYITDNLQRLIVWAVATPSIALMTGLLKRRADRASEKALAENIARDISERKRIEEEHAQLLVREREERKAAEEANRLKDEFLATVSHELRTPLTSILGWIELLRDGELNGSSTASALETIERNAKAEAQILEDLLDVSRIITGKLRLDIQPIEIAPIIGVTIDAARPTIEAKGIQLDIMLDTEVGIVSGDPDRLQQVIWNLLSNAIKFTPKGGRIKVRLVRTDSHIEIAVSDTGQGISPEFLPHVFERFRQGESTMTRRHGGLGIGLAIARHLVELHGGTIRVSSEGEGRGATFTVQLPLLTACPNNVDRPEPIPQDLPNDSSTPLNALRVLVVDDEPDTRELLVVILSQYGAKVKAVASTAEALEILEHWRPDVLISDIGMPNGDGYVLIRKIRERAPEQGGQIPAAALTAYARAEDRRRALLAGFQMHVPKPIEPAKLAAVVGSLAGRGGK